MATFASILVPSDDADIKVAALAASTASAAQTVGLRAIVAVNADQDITIVFYQAAVGTKTPTAANFRIPANQTQTFDMGSINDTIRVFNLNGASAANIWIKKFSRI